MAKTILQAIFEQLEFHKLFLTSDACNTQIQANWLTHLSSTVSSE